MLLCNNQFFVTKCKITCTKLFRAHNFLTVADVTVWQCLWDSVHMWANQLISIILHLKTPKEKSGMPQAYLISKCNKFNLLFLIFFFFSIFIIIYFGVGTKERGYNKATQSHWSNQYYKYHFGMFIKMNLCVQARLWISFHFNKNGQNDSF